MFICVKFSVHFYLETGRNFCLGKYRVRFNVCCSLYMSVRKETQISQTNMSETKRTARKAPHFLLNFAKNPCLNEKCPSTSKQVRKFRMKRSSEGRWCIDLAQKM